MLFVKLEVISQENSQTLLPFDTPQEIKEEFTAYQLLEDTDIPQEVWGKATVHIDESHSQVYHRMDVLWHHISAMKAPDSTYRYYRLSNSYAHTSYSTLQCSRGTCLFNGSQEQNCISSKSGSKRDIMKHTYN